MIHMPQPKTRFVSWAGFALPDSAEWREIFSIVGPFRTREAEFDCVRANYHRLMGCLRIDLGADTVEIVRINRAWEAAQRELAA